MKDKKYYRHRIKNERKTSDLFENEEKDNSIYEKLIKIVEFDSCKKLFIYVSFDMEINTHKIIKLALEKGKNVYVPKVISKDFGMLAVRLNNLMDLKKNRMGILEPIDKTEIIDPKDIDLAIIPGLAFDLKGNRIGYGGGYYDRFFSDKKKKLPIMIALAYESQVFPQIQEETYDIIVDKIITEKNVYNISNI